jgi:hypothetical protein
MRRILDYKLKKADVHSPGLSAQVGCPCLHSDGLEQSLPCPKVGLPVSLIICQASPTTWAPTYDTMIRLSLARKTTHHLHGLESETAVTRFVGARTWNPSRSVLVPCAASGDLSTEERKAKYHIRPVKWVLTVALSPRVSIPLRNAILGRAGESDLARQRPSVSGRANFLL